MALIARGAEFKDCVFGEVGMRVCAGEGGGVVGVGVGGRGVRGRSWKELGCAGWGSGERGGGLVR